MNQLIDEYIAYGFYAAVQSPNFLANYAEFFIRPIPKGWEADYLEANIAILAATVDAARAAGFKIEGDPRLRNTAILHRVAFQADRSTGPETWELLCYAVAELIKAGAVITQPKQPAPPQQVINLSPHFDIRTEQPATEVVITLPEQIGVSIDKMPERVTTSTVERDRAGNIVSTTQVERDA